MLSFYTEGPFLSLALLAMLAREKGNMWTAAVCFAACTCVRANGYLFAGFFIFDAARATLQARGKVGVTLQAWIGAIVATGIVC